MKYVVLTTRHHDGFAFWDTQTSDFNAARLGPKRDLLVPYVDAARRAGLRVGFYYSFADWSHPDYPDAFARDWPTQWRDEATRKRFIHYVRTQLRELLTSYGKIDILWYDGCIPGPLDGGQTNAMVRELQPDILINSRMGPADFVNSEQAIVPPKENVPWEACMTLNASWGYHAGDHQWKTPKRVIEMLTEAVRGGGTCFSTWARWLTGPSQPSPNGFCVTRACGWPGIVSSSKAACGCHSPGPHLQP